MLFILLKFIFSLDEFFCDDSLFIIVLLFFFLPGEFKRNLLLIFIFTVFFLFDFIISSLFVFNDFISCVIFSICSFISFILLSVIFINSSFIFLNDSTWVRIFSIFVLLSKSALSTNALSSTFFVFISPDWFSKRLLISKYFPSEYFWQLKIALSINVDEFLIILSIFDFTILFSNLNFSFSIFIFEKSWIFCFIYSDKFLYWHPGPICPVTCKFSVIILSHFDDKYSISETIFFILTSFLSKFCSKFCMVCSNVSILSKFNFWDVNNSKRELLLWLNVLNFLLIESHIIFVSVNLLFISVDKRFSKRRTFFNISSLNWIKSVWNEWFCI